jgi:Ala-tRNA(Pro) deacylase
MIPIIVEAHLRARHPWYEHHVHARALTAQELAASDHVSGKHVAKPVIVKLGDRMVMAVVAATDRVNLAVLEEATGVSAELVPETEFARRFQPCEPGSEPPLSVFGMPIFVDEKLEREPTLVMSAGTHEDAVELDTREWLRCEQAQPIQNLGLRIN